MTKKEQLLLKEIQEIKNKIDALRTYVADLEDELTKERQGIAIETINSYITEIENKKDSNETINFPSSSVRIENGNKVIIVHSGILEIVDK